MRRLLSLAAAAAALSAAPLAAQYGPRGGDRTAFSVEPYAAYGFFGTLPAGGPRLDGDAAFGVRGALRINPQFALTGTWQHATPRVDGGERATVEHWAGGVEFDYHPREGASGIPPVVLEAGVGQVRYDFRDGFDSFDFKQNDIAANVGISSAIPLSRSVAVTYGVNDWISNWEGDQGMVNQVFARVGAQINF
jgi:hypothetical protein